LCQATGTIPSTAVWYHRGNLTVGCSILRPVVAPKEVIGKLMRTVEAVASDSGCALVIIMVIAMSTVKSVYTRGLNVRSAHSKTAVTSKWSVLHAGKAGIIVAARNQFTKIWISVSST